jgi:large subunit ribosomal protein L6
MSRVGKKPLPLPKGVEASINGRLVTVKGAKGELKQELPPSIGATMAAGEGGLQDITFTPQGNPRQLSASWGTARSLVANMVKGVTQGFNLNLKLIGVGYRAAVQGKKLNMTLGYSHPIEVDIPAGLTLDVKDQTEISITGNDKQIVGQFAAKVRGYRSPEPFKGKGVRYANEFIAMKEGKKK